MATQAKLEYSIYNTEGKTDGSSSLDLTIATNTSRYLVHRAMVKQLADKRQGTASTKTRSEVSGGGKKPWKQKGSGRARAGSNRSPLWRGGGVTFGPQPRSYYKKMNRKEWRLALRTLFYNKSHSTIVIEDMNSYFVTPSTKKAVDSLTRWSVTPNQKTIIITESPNKNIYLSTRNLPNVKTLCATNLNILDILNAQRIIISRDAILKIQEVFND
mgnify:CR=1 FL=1